MMKSRRRQRDDQGLSMVEVSVAMVVLAIVIAALGAFLITAISAQRSNEMKTRAVSIGNDAVESARALPWTLLGHYADDATAPAACTGGDPLVLLAVPVAPAIKSDRVRPAATAVQTVDGIDYTETVCYRWYDDPSDGAGAADPDGTTDVKRIEVKLSWVNKGELRTLTASGVRVPTVSEVAPKSASGATPFGIISVTPSPAAVSSATIDASGKTTAPLDFTATTTTGVSTVNLRWTDSGGIARSAPLTGGASTTSWSYTLPLGSGPFAAANTVFSFVAFGANGDQSTQDVTIAFSSSPSTLVIDDFQANPNSVDTETTGYTKVVFEVIAKTNLDVSSILLTYKTRSGSTTTVPMTMSSTKEGRYTFPIGAGPFPDGISQFTAVASGAAGTASRSMNLTFVPPTVTPVTLVSQVVDKTVCVAQSNGKVERASVIDTVVTGVLATDTLVLQLNDTAGTRVTATYLSTSAAGLLFRYTLPVSSSGVSFKNKDSFSPSVTATRQSDNTQATKLYSYSIFQRNGNAACPTS